MRSMNHITTYIIRLVFGLGEERRLRLIVYHAVHNMSLKNLRPQPDNGRIYIYSVTVSPALYTL